MCKNPIPLSPPFAKGEGARFAPRPGVRPTSVIKFALKLARQSLRAARRVEESPGSAEQDAG